MSANAADAPREVKELPVNVSGVRATGWWGMASFVLTDLTLFASLLSSYFYLASTATVWPPDGIAPDTIGLPIVGTVLLLASSWPIVMAERSIRRGSRGGLLIGLAIAWVLAAAFIALQIYGYTTKSFSPKSDVYGSLYFTILTVHGIHVVIELLMVAVLFAQALMGAYSPRRFLAVQNVGLYWHFVGAVWIVIFTSLILYPHWA